MKLLIDLQACDIRIKDKLGQKERGPAAVQKREEDLAAAKALLQVCSMLGRDFSYRLLLTVSESANEAALLEGLDLAQDTGGFILIVPEFRRGLEGFQVQQFRLQRRKVKDPP